MDPPPMPAPTLSTVVLGLGLFFLGIQLIGRSLQRLAGPSFAALVQRTTHSRVQASLVGILFGALMQSATAVTFILVGMVSSGIVETAAVEPIVVWCNVGLTALAFVTTFDIHPLVAWLVGGAGIASGVLGDTRQHAGARVLLGMGLILFGLENMGSGAAHFSGEPWFRAMLAATQGRPLLAFGTGIAAAALLQSNTGASMLVITLAGIGLLPLHEAVLLIYGSNLGAIALRAILALSLRGRSLRLVRMEDLFCVTSGLLMLGLDLLETAGIPLVRAGVVTVTSQVRLQLALAFLLSNLLPALALTPALGWCRRLLEHLIPEGPAGEPGAPRYLTPRAMDDPGTAIVLLQKELVHLLGLLSVKAERPPDGQREPDPAFVQLGLTIERFAARLAATGNLSELQATRVQTLRGALSTIRHLEDAMGDVCIALGRLGDGTPEAAITQDAADTLNGLLRDAAAVADRLAPGEVSALLERTRKRGEVLERLRERLAARREAIPADDRLHVVALQNDVEVAVWMAHRLAKVLTGLATPAAGA